MRLLSGHISPETAYLVEDYPYGYRLRCKSRYWLEHNPTRGVRLVSQTTNPKVAGEVWNKPKASTYARFSGAMYLDEEGHVTWTELHEYMTAEQCVAWGETYGSAAHPATSKVAEAWIKAKKAYEAKKQAA
jgi:hypothetical protein